jgi:flagellar protein FlaJ
MKLKGGEVGSAARTEGADEEKGGLKLPSMSEPPVLTEQPLEPELLELIEEDDADAGGGDAEHKMKILSAIDDTSGGAGYGKSGALDEFAKHFHHWLRLFMMVPFVVLGDRIRAQAAHYRDLRIKLQQARIPVSYEMYVSSSLFYSAVAGIIGAILGLVISFVVIRVIGLPDKITKLTFSESTAWLIDYKWIFLTLFLIVFLSIVLGGIVYVLFLLYPAFKASGRKGDIDRNLPYAVTFMYALSNGGMNIVEIFRSLAECKDTYGEVANEVDTVVRDMEYFGHDLRTALRNTSELTPSAKFQDLTHNLLAVIDSGGDIPKYFKDKSDQYLKEAIIDQKGYLETLGLIAESYVTAFVAGPLFIIIMGVMMVLMGSGNDMMLYAIIYAVIPVGSVMFVVMIDMLSPSASGIPALLSTRAKLDHEVVMPPELVHLKADKNAPADPEIERLLGLKKLWARFIKSKKTLAVRQTLKDPLKSVKMSPVNILLVSVPAALIVFAVAYVTHRHELLSFNLTVNFLDDYLVYAAYIALVPLAFFHEMKMAHERKLQKQIPDFLGRMASTNETGMTIRDSIKLMSKSDTGAISKQIKLVWKDIDWGMDVNDALTRFANRIRTHVVARSITLITRANESSGDVGEVLSVAARDAETEQTLRKERAMNMMIYIVIIYISFVVFVGVIYVITDSFLTQMAIAGEEMEASGAAGGGGFLGAFDLDAYKRMFFHASLIQGFCSGLIAGVMGEGSVMSGLKHSMIMMTIALLIFKLAVGGV